LHISHPIRRPRARRPRGEAFALRPESGTPGRFLLLADETTSN
jgi:hypothetical protein